MLERLNPAKIATFASIKVPRVGIRYTMLVGRWKGVNDRVFDIQAKKFKS